MFKSIQTISINHRLFAFWVFLLVVLTGNLEAQNKAEQNKGAELLPFVESRIEQQGIDTAFYFIIEMVRENCDDDVDCLFNTYDHLKHQLSAIFGLVPAVYLGEEQIRIAYQAKDWEKEAKARYMQYTYYGALGNLRLATINHNRVEELYKKMGDQASLYTISTYKIEQQFGHQGAKAVAVELEKLLEEVIRVKPDIQDRIRVRLMIHTHDAGLFDRMEDHIAFLEEQAKIKDDYPYHFDIAKSRGDLYTSTNKPELADSYYQKCLQMVKEVPNHWSEVYVLLQLARMEWDRENTQLTKSYLDQALNRATEFNDEDHLQTIFAFKSEIAEKEGRFADALAFNKKIRIHEENRENVKGNFSVEAFYLQLEKEQLVVEKEKKELELQLNKLKLRNALVITALSIFLVALLIYGFYRLQKNNKELAEQKDIVQKQAVHLKNLDVTKSRFFANISHELRTPLSLVLGPISLLTKEKRLDDRQLKLLNMASQNGKQLEQLVSEILDLSKLEIGKMEVEVERTKVASFFRNYFLQFESLAYRKQIDYSFEILVSKKLVANIDRAKCRQILYNLLSNAFKFTPANGQIEATISMNNDMLQLKVEDTGPGIHPDDLPHLFERYFQTNQPDKPAAGGSGIGLALCHEYAQLFGGEIKAESVYGNGATLIIEFPIKVIKENIKTELIEEPATKTISEEVAIASQPPKVTPAQIAMPTKDTNSNKPKVLVVEDNEELQEYISMVIQRKYSVVTANNGKVALELLQKSTDYNLIISDLMMPEMDGYQLLENLKSDNATRQIPVIMLTARADARDKMKALRIGVDDYLLKPFDEEELMVRIGNLLKNQEERHTFTIEDKTEGKRQDITNEEQERLISFESYVQENLSLTHLSVPLLAAAFTMSESSLRRMLKQLTGLTPAKYLQEMRLDKARQLLENEKVAVKKVALNVGFSDVRTFSRNFKNRFGKLPSDYRLE